MWILRIAVVVVGTAGFLTADERGARLLAQARSAIGGETRLAKVESLAATGTALHPMPDGGRVGELKIELQWPDRLLRTDSMRPGGGDPLFVMFRGVNGNLLLRNSKIINGGPGHRFSKPPLHGGTDALALQYAKHELARFTIAFLLRSPMAASLHVTDGGVAESPDGKADVLKVSTADGFAVTMFLDQSSHRPLMMTYRDFDPRLFVVRQNAAAGAVVSVETEMAEITWYFDDYRTTAGIAFPHRITRAVNGDDDEEWAFKAFVVNPVFKAGAFTDQ